MYINIKYILFLRADFGEYFLPHNHNLIEPDILLNRMLLLLRMFSRYFYWVVEYIIYVLNCST